MIAVLKLRVTQLVNIFEALEKETAFYYVQKNGAKESYLNSDQYSPHPTAVYFLPR